LQFQKLTLEHIDTIRPFFRINPYRYCDRTLGATMMWRDFADTHFCIENDILILRSAYVGDGVITFTPPLLPRESQHNDERRFAEAVRNIVLFCVQSKIPTVFAPVAGSDLALILGLYPNAEVIPERSWFDYIYDAEALRSFAGRRYQGQRNHINRLTDTCPDWSFETINHANLHEARAYLERYTEEHPKQEYPLYSEGNIKAIEVLDNWDKYRQCGGLLFIGGGSSRQTAGVSLGDICGDTLYIHTEKATREIQGAYPALVREFARAFTGDGVEYINREEDDGVEGLRISKESYHPLRLIEKYRVQINL